MVTVPAGPVETIDRAARAALISDLRDACKRYGITQQAIADRCKVTRPFIVNLFAGRSWSGEVIATIQTMIAEAKRRAPRNGRR